MTRRALLAVALVACAPPRWEGEVTVSIVTDDPERRSAAERAVATWSAALGDLGVGLVLAEPGDIRIHWSVTASERYADAIGATVVQWGLGHRANIHLRADLDWSHGERCERGYDLEAGVAHELGHALGLAHLDEREATMYARIASCDVEKRSLSRADLDALRALYE